jgi:hypothetical protein
MWGCNIFSQSVILSAIFKRSGSGGVCMHACVRACVVTEKQRRAGENSRLAVTREKWKKLSRRDGNRPVWNVPWMVSTETVFNFRVKFCMKDYNRNTPIPLFTNVISCIKCVRKMKIRKIENEIAINFNVKFWPVPDSQKCNPILFPDTLEHNIQS